MNEIEENIKNKNIRYKKKRRNDSNRKNKKNKYYF